MSSLRSAITYIKCLNDLLEDCDAGRVGEEVYKKSLLLDEREKQKMQAKTCEKKKFKTRNQANQRKKVLAKFVDKKAGTEKWTNYSEHYLEHRFAQSLHGGGFSDNVVTSSETLQLQQSLQQHEKAAVPVSSSYPSSPVDVNEISLHISLLGSDRDMASDEGKVYYVCAVNEI